MIYFECPTCGNTVEELEYLEWGVENYICTCNTKFRDFKMKGGELVVTGKWECNFNIKKEGVKNEGR